MPFEKPLARTREYVKIVRDIVARNGNGHQRRAALSAAVSERHRPRQAAEARRSTQCATTSRSSSAPRDRRTSRSRPRSATGGWRCSSRPRNQDFYRDALAEGFARDGARRSWDDFEVTATVPVIIHDDVEQAADFLRPMYALYFGGMGARGRNFHHDVAVRLGYEAEAKKIQDLYLDGKKDEAAAAIPTKLVEDLALIGPEDKIRDELDAWRESIVDHAADRRRRDDDPPRRRPRQQLAGHRGRRRLRRAGPHRQHHADDQDPENRAEEADKSDRGRADQPRAGSRSNQATPAARRASRSTVRSRTAGPSSRARLA